MVARDNGNYSHSWEPHIITDIPGVDSHVFRYKISNTYHTYAEESHTRSHLYSDLNDIQAENACFHTYAFNTQ